MAEESTTALLQGEGLHVMLSRIIGVTNKSVLQKPFLFQCPPLETFRRSYGQAWTDYTTLGGPHSRPSFRQLASITFNTLFVDGGHSFALIDPAPLNVVDHGKLAWHIKDELDALDRTAQLLQIMHTGTPFHLAVGNPLYLPGPDSAGKHEVDMDATLRSLDVEERHGEPDARYIDVQFVEFPGLPKRVAASKLPVKLTIAKLPKSKNTMHKLASLYYHEPAKWKLIAKRNPFLKGVGANVNLVAKFGKSKSHKYIIVPKES